MKRRSFIAAILAGAVAPGLFLPRLEQVKWKRSGDIWIPNPNWRLAEYELVTIGLDHWYAGLENRYYYKIRLTPGSNGLCASTDLSPQFRRVDEFILVDRAGKV